MFIANGLLSFVSSFGLSSLIAMSKFPTPSLLKRILAFPFFTEIAFKVIGSFSPLNNSVTDICRFNSSKATNVSPTNGALFIMTSFSIPTFALGKFLNKLKLASSKVTLASTFSLMLC